MRRQIEKSHLKDEISKAAMKRVISDILSEQGKETLRFTDKARTVIHHALNSYGQEIMTLASILSACSNRVTTKGEDVLISAGITDKVLLNAVVPEHVIYGGECETLTDRIHTALYRKTQGTLMSTSWRIPQGTQKPVASTLVKTHSPRKPVALTQVKATSSASTMRLPTAEPHVAFASERDHAPSSPTEHDKALASTP